MRIKEVLNGFLPGVYRVFKAGNVARVRALFVEKRAQKVAVSCGSTIFVGMKSIIPYLFLAMCCLVAGQASAQVVYPTAAPSAVYITSKGEEITDASDTQSAPLIGRFSSNVTDLGEYTVRYEWRVYREGQEQSPMVHRFDENLEYTFNESGTFLVQFYATFAHQGDTINYPEPGEANPFVVVVSESVLEMPNAFSPNGDGYNDVYKAKEGHKSIVSFKATIFNRWGQKLYSWDDIDGGWDGKAHGTTVHDGVYFVVVEARGADGKEYKIRKDVNVLTKTNGTTGNQ